MSATRAKLPDHVVKHIETTTGLPIALTGTHAKPGTCPTCHTPILAGYDSPAAASLAIVDPQALTPQLEAAALILNRPTWRLWGRPGTYELTNRTFPGNPTTLKYPPASPECIVVVKHECGKPLGGTPIQTHPTAPADYNHEPPY